jgi:hypothetical protein
MARYTDFLVHLDTLGLRSDAALLGVGGMFFNMEGEGQFSLYNAITVESNEGRNFSHLDIDFWRHEAPYLDPFRRELVDLSTAIDELDTTFQAHSEPHVSVWYWTGAFEGTVLQTCFEGLGRPMPWPYYIARDAKTFCCTESEYARREPFATPYGDSPENQMERRVEKIRRAHQTFKRLHGARSERAGAEYARG